MCSTCFRPQRISLKDTQLLASPVKGCPASDIRKILFPIQGFPPVGSCDEGTELSAVPVLSQPRTWCLPWVPRPSSFRFPRLPQERRSCRTPSCNIRSAESAENEQLCLATASGFLNIQCPVTLPPSNLYIEISN